jgi:3'-5' exoribonuclease
MQALIISAEKAQAKNGSEYLRVRFSDEKRTEHSAVLFSDMNPEGIKGTVCELTVRSGTPTDKIEALKVLDGEDPSLYVRKTLLDVDKMLAELQAVTRGDGIDPDLTKIVDKVLFSVQQRVERFKTWPAAAHAHHGFQGGLIEHTWGMMQSALAVAKLDPASKGLNIGVVACSIALHDIGKIWAYSFSTGAATEHTLLHHSLGHICIADEQVVRACAELGIPSNRGNVLNMRHCILAHHGKLEWGSPIVPATREAVFVHQIDMLQSRAEMALEGTEGLELGKASSIKHRQLEAWLAKI